MSTLLLLCNTVGTLLVWFVIRTCTMDKSHVMYHLSLQGEGQVVRYIIHLWSLCIIITYSIKVTTKYLRHLSHFITLPLLKYLYTTRLYSLVWLYLDVWPTPGSTDLSVPILIETVLPVF